MASVSYTHLDVYKRQEPGLDILFLCEPNNPTGRTTPRALLLRILERCAACGTRLVVDECFNEFLDDPAADVYKRQIPVYLKGAPNT